MFKKITARLLASKPKMKSIMREQQSLWCVAIIRNRKKIDPGVE
jgi:hypothetical protein